MMTISEFKVFLTALRDDADARLCGSFARHEEDITPGFLSDIDLVVEHHPYTDDWGNPIVGRPLDRAVEVFTVFGVPVESILIGQISSPREMEPLPRPIEVMDTMWIDPDPKYPEIVEVYGVEFKTYQMAGCWNA